MAGEPASATFETTVAATGNNTGIVDRLMRLAEEADAARRTF